jgi:cation-transporting ATPase I
VVFRLRSLTRLCLTAALTPPVLVLREARPVLDVGAEVLDRTLHAASEAVGAGTRTAVRVSRVARNAGTPRPAPWRAGRRLHIPLRAGTDAAAGATTRLAEVVAGHADVVAAYWDGGLTSLVVWLAEEAAEGELLAWLAEQLDLLDLHPVDRPVDPNHAVLAHPGDTTSVRTAALALAMSGAGLGIAIGAHVVRARRAHDLLQAAVTALREHPRARALLDERFGWSHAELARAAADAATRGLTQSPAQLALDVLLRTGQLTETVARAAAFDAAHDTLCTPHRPSLGLTPDTRDRAVPVEDYARGAIDSGLLGALAALVLRRNPGEAANAVLAASPMPARYTHTAFHAALGTVLAREGVLVRDPDRLRSLDTVDALVLHASALGGRHLDPHAEAVLDAARAAGMQVVIVGTPATGVLGEFTSLADDLVTGTDAAAFRALVDRLHEDGRVVLTVARPGPGDGPRAASVAGLLCGDVCVAITDDTAAVVWGADLIVPDGLVGVWRVLLAAGAARATSRRATELGTASALLGGLLLLGGRGEGRARRRLLPSVPQLSPDVLAGAIGLALGWGAALRVAVAGRPAARERVAWHELTSEETIRRLRADRHEPTPLQHAVAVGRAWFAELVELPVAAPARYGVQLLGDVAVELNDPLTPVLALGAVASAVIGSPVDAVLVGAAMGLSAFVGGAQRFRGRIALAKLTDDERARARRVSADGAIRDVDAGGLRAGDTIALQVGDVVPADARLVELADLEVDESALTGESVPVAKQLDPAPGAPLPERHCLVFAGTTVVSGHAQALVVATGKRTVSGRAVNLAARAPAAAGIQATLRELTRKAIPLTLGGGALVTALSALRGTPMRRAVAGGVAIAVAAVPEGLPLVATVAQLAAARRLSRRGVLVRSPRALEALGRLDTICFDKTGTLTANQLRVRTVTDSQGERTEDRAALIAAARACPGSAGDRAAHVTDHAIQQAAGTDTDWTELAGQPFEANRGYSAAVGRDTHGATWLLVKGAPEIVLPACARQARLTEAGTALADSGLRVLAVAGRPIAEDEEPPALCNGGDGVLAELRFLGFVGLSDIPRDGAADVVDRLRAAGIAPVMLTGDHPNTARAIAVNLGWPPDCAVVTGDELAAMDGAERAECLAEGAVIARVAPEQKLQVVETLRSAGKVTAMVGDGANDAAAIRAAHVGVGIRAETSMAARSAADIALAEDDLGVLLEAIDEGRALWRSVSDAVTILVGGNAGEVGFSVLGSLVDGNAPLSTRQFLLVNLFTDLFPAMSVAVTRPDTDTTRAGGLDEDLNRDIRGRGITTGIGATTAWLLGRVTPGTARRTSTMALCGLVGAQLAQTLRGRWHSPLVVGTAVGSAAALGVVVQTPGLSQFFGCTPLGPIAWTGVAAGVGTAALASLLPPLRPANP